MKRTICAALLTVTSFAVSTLASAQDWTNRPKAIAKVEQLQEFVEILDESIHEIQGADKVIEFIHHFEETVSAAAEDLKVQSFDDARHELEHMTEDLFEVYERLDEVNFFNSVEVIYAWNDVAQSYVAFERSMDYPN